MPEVPGLVDYEDPPLRHAHRAVGRHVRRLVAVTSAVGAGAGEQGGQLRQTLDLPINWIDDLDIMLKLVFSHVVDRNDSSTLKISGWRSITSRLNDLSADSGLRNRGPGGSLRLPWLGTQYHNVSIALYK